MKSQLAVWGFIFSLGTCLDKASADCAFAVATTPSNKKIVVEYSWSVGGNDRDEFQRDAECTSALKKNGNKNVSRLLFDNRELDSGVFVIISSTYRHGDKKHYIMGAGAGKNYTEALRNALACLSSYDDAWNRNKHSYHVEKTLRF